MPAGARVWESAIGVGVIVAVAVLAIFPALALPVLGAAQLVAALGCVRAARTAVGLRPPAYGATTVFVVLGLFWAGMAALFFWSYFQP